jgi:hypothetical protein
LASFSLGTFSSGAVASLPWGLRLSPFMIASSGAPYNVTLSQDLIGSAQLNQRPSFSTSPGGGPIVTVPGFATYNTIPGVNAAPIPIDDYTGPGHFTLNLRLAKTFNFGPESKGSAGGGPPGGGGGRGGRGSNPFADGGFSGGGSSPARRYSIILSINARNIFNYVNLANPSAVLNPPAAAGANASYNTGFFGVSNALAGGSFSTNSANRQIYLQAGFSF